MWTELILDRNLNSKMRVNGANDSAECNHAEVVGSEDGTIHVPQYDWSDYLKTFFKRQAFKGIKSLHHLVVSVHHC